MSSLEFSECQAYFQQLSPDERWDQSWFQTDTLARGVLAPWSKKQFKEGAFIPGYKRRPQTEEEMQAEFHSAKMAMKTAALRRKANAKKMSAGRQRARELAAQRRKRRKGKP